MSEKNKVVVLVMWEILAILYSEQSNGCGFYGWGRMNYSNKNMNGWLNEEWEENFLKRKPWKYLQLFGLFSQSPIST